MTAGYARFRDRILAEDIEFGRDGDPRHLERIGELLDALPAPRGGSPAAERWTFSGWLLPGSRLSKRRVRALNPRARVSIVRLPRPDAGRRGILLRLGFRVVVETAPAKTARLDLGPGRRLRASSEPVEHQLDVLGEAPGGVHAAWLDGIRVAASPSEADPGRWPESLVAEEPAHLAAFASSPRGAAWRARFAAELARFPVLDRWADRYRLMESGLAGPFVSDLDPLAVVIPFPDVREPAEPVALPEWDRADDVAVARAGDRALPAPGSGWMVVDDAQIQDGGLVTRGGELIAYETAALPQLRGVAGLQHSVFGSAASPDAALVLRRAPAAGTLDEGILLGGRSDANWYHWLAEYLPRVLSLPTSVGAEVPLLVSDRVPATGLAALSELSDRPVIALDPQRRTRVARLHLAAPRMQLLDDPTVPWSDGLRVDGPALGELRRRWIDAGATGFREVFVSRRSGARRGIRGEDALVEIAREAGLEIVDPSELSFAQQRELFGSVRLLVGGSGAVMANYLMLPPGAEILALTSAQLTDFVAPAVLAQIARARFRYLAGTSALTLANAQHRTEWIHADFAIDPARFRAELAAALARSRETAP